MKAQEIIDQVIQDEIWKEHQRKIMMENAETRLVERIAWRSD